MKLLTRLDHYAKLMRLHKPIGSLLLLWPTLWALWLASDGKPDLPILFIFVVGVFLMRACGCVINDFADRAVDGKVKRTRERPLASGKVSVKEALGLFAFLLLLALCLALQLNRLSLYYAFIGALVTAIYPFMKRFTHLPQLGLGVAFSWGIPMAFVAQGQALGFSGWFLFFTALLWPLIYDTFYAMTDREDDLVAGIKSTAILFAASDRLITALLQLLFLICLMALGVIYSLAWPYYLSLLAVVGFFVYQQWLISTRQPELCFKAFLNNNWVGLCIFGGILGGIH